MARQKPYQDEEPDSLIPNLTDDEGDIEQQSSHDLHIRTASETSEHGLPVPAWLRQASKSTSLGWIPQPAKRVGSAVATWVKGPQPPRELRIEPYFPKLQEAPIKLLDRYVPKQRHRACLLIAFFATWFLVWSLMLKKHAGTGEIEGYGKPSNIWCGATFWQNGNKCGLNGNDCRPFANQYLAFRCPANCASALQYNEHTVGNETIEFEQQVIGGPSSSNPDASAIYRADSFICQAAVHAGAISNGNGGCGVALLVGGHSGYEASYRNGIKSHGFPSDFPRSFIFPELKNGANKCPSASRWPIFAVTAVALVILSLFTTSPATFFWGTFVILMFHVGLVSDPPDQPNFYELISTLMGRLLPASFVAAIMYRWCARPLLTGLTAQIEKTILYLGFCFLGALNNYTFAPLIPIGRLTPHDLAQPGAAFALAVIVTVVLVIIITQIHWIRLSGNMPRYLVVYGLMALALIILVSLPGLRLRIHHYILGILFMPGTAFRVRPSLAYQGLLLGFFINGIARWGFDSIIQTPAALGEGNGGHGRSWWGAKAPKINATLGRDGEVITFNWGALPAETGIDGVSILINDVERWRGYTDDELFWDPDRVTLSRRWRQENETEFYRFAWMNGNNAGRYSKAAVWDADGTWHDAPSR
ncbi:hypothetical protein H2198_002200 [Neophaeococcomyces mojaviensis]|uniref:Uncharacterized protein n=1 Tax=Neophaeococcomyces mojaviensis TaxID=3383035 RepID=A0ACC3AFC9_9EURO|nr:hypothetical protein H2198_002200 [Knufia sp. JES_112]